MFFWNTKTSDGLINFLFVAFEELTSVSQVYTEDFLDHQRKLHALIS